MLPDNDSATVLDTAGAVWSFLVDRGGIDAKRYDQPLIDEMRSILSLPEGGDFGQLLSEKVSVEEFVVAFFTAAEPYASMMADLMAAFERAGVKRSNQAMHIDFDFGAARSLRFDLEQFKEWIERWKSVSRIVETNQWSAELLWNIQSALPHNDSPLSVKVEEWLGTYRSGRLPTAAPPVPVSGVAELDTRIRRLWRVLQRVVEESARYAPTRDALREVDREWRSAGRREEPNFIGETSSWTPDLLYRVEGDLWAGSIVEKSYRLAQQASSMPSAELSRSIDVLITTLDEIWRRLPKVEFQHRGLASVLWAVLSLPFWERRHELYSTWVFTQILEAVEPLAIRIHAINGTLKFSFSGSHLATVDSLQPRLHVWAELRSPLNDPRGKSRTGAIQPDYSLITDPLTAPEASILEIECKQYLKASARNFSDALTDYANGRPNAQVILVNYGGASDSILDRVDAQVRQRTHLVGTLRPDRAESKERFKTLILGVLESRFPLLNLRAVAANTAIPVTSPGEISLTWNDKPLDLDLHLRIEGNRRATSLIQYNELGELDGGPFAQLEKDVQSGFGPELIRISKWLGGKYYCAVHNFSNEIPLAKCGAQVNLRAGGVDRAFLCPSEGEGRWWLVFSLDSETGSMQELNEIVPFPWREQVILEENFSDNGNNWSETYHELAIRDGAYLFSHRRLDKLRYSWKSIGIDEMQDFRVETTISRISGVDESWYGLVWGLKDVDNMYSFSVRSDGFFRVSREDEESLDFLIHWKRCPYLAAGNATTELAIEKRGNTMTFIINGHPVEDLPFQKFFGSNVGFEVHSKIEILIRSVKVTQLQKRRKQ